MAYHPRTIQILLCALVGLHYCSAFECDLTNNCLCYQPTPTTYKFHCPLESPKIITHTNLDEIEVECMTDVDWGDQDLPKLEIQHVKSLKITKCSLPKQGLDEFLSKLVVNSTDIVKFSSWSKFDNTSSAPRLIQKLNRFSALDISENNLEKIDEFEFARILDLIYLNLSINALNDLPSTLFRTLVNLKVLDLKQNNITSLPKGIFATNTHLEHLDISANPIDLKTIPVGELPSIKRLYLSNVQIGNFPVNFFDNLTQLEDLNLSNNRISILPEFTFRSLTKLKFLNLEANLLTHITKGLFSNNLHLEKVNFGNNSISHINIHALQRNVNLKEIIIANNKFRLTETQIRLGVSPFQANINLERLDLSRNKITHISDDWVLPKIHLKELDLSHNEIRFLTLTDLIGVSPNLSIDLSNNKISTVDFRMANHIASNTNHLYQRIVTLNQNPLKCDCFLYDFARYFDGTINPLIPVTIKVVADNLRCAEPKEYLDKLVEEIQPNSLSCSVSNCPERCKCGFRIWDRALVIDCSNKNLTEVPVLPFEESNLYNYTEVDLQRNLITKGPTEAMRYTNVRKLNLAFNNISTVSWIPPKLKMLNLSHNNIEHLDEDVFHKFNASSTLGNLLLGSNPWKCGCEALHLRSFMITHLISKRMIDADNIKCKNDGRLVIHLNIHDVCMTYSRLIVICSLILTLMAILISIITCACAFSRRKKLYTAF